MRPLFHSTYGKETQAKIEESRFCYDTLQQTDILRRTGERLTVAYQAAPKDTSGASFVA
jgi:hypothetical protein